QKLIEIINNLHITLDKPNNREEIGALLQEMFSYASFHFDFEENYLVEHDYKEMDEHIKEHNYYIERVKELRRLHEKGDDLVPYDMIDFLQVWLLEHIQKTDREYAKGLLF
ncbi:MAG: hypothetical protein C0594_02180, partial [Marinilabiliales bacterium]